MASAKSSKGEKSTQRKLTAILCANVVGYSRLMGGSIWEISVYGFFMLML